MGNRCGYLIIIAKNKGNSSFHCSAAPKQPGLKTKISLGAELISEDRKRAGYSTTTLAIPRLIKALKSNQTDGSV